MNICHLGPEVELSIITENNNTSCDLYSEALAKLIKITKGKEIHSSVCLCIYVYTHSLELE